MMNEEERKEGSLWVCERCLEGIKCHEGHLPVKEHCVDEDDEKESRCDWCEESGNDVLFELM